MPTLSTDRHAAAEADFAAGVHSVEIGALVLHALLRAGAPVPLKAVAAATGFPRAKAHRYLASLVRSELARQDTSSGHYGLGPLAIELGLAALAQVDRDGLAREALHALCDACGATAGLCIWGRDGPMVTAVQPAPGALFIGMRPGAVLPLTDSASGQVFITHLRDGLWRPLLKADAGRRPLGSRAIDTLRRRVRRNGVGVARDSVSRGLNGLAAPVFDHTGELVSTLTLVGPAGQFDVSVDGAAADAIRHAAGTLSHRLGWRGPDTAGAARPAG